MEQVIRFVECGSSQERCVLGACIGEEVGIYTVEGSTLAVELESL